MKNLLRLEEFAQMLLGIAAIHLLPFQLSWWLWIILFFSPDIAMIGYIFGSRFGGTSYNLFHHKGLALLVATIGFLVKSEALILAGSLLFAHASFDRIWGFGLKYLDDFKHTHLGWTK